MRSSTSIQAPEFLNVLFYFISLIIILPFWNFSSPSSSIFYVDKTFAVRLSNTIKPLNVWEKNFSSYFFPLILDFYFIVTHSLYTWKKIIFTSYDANCLHVRFARQRKHYWTWQEKKANRQQYFFKRPLCLCVELVLIAENIKKAAE